MFYNTDKNKTRKLLSVTSAISRTVALTSAVSLHLACEILILLCCGICQPGEGTSPLQLHLRPKEITSAGRVKKSPACAVLTVAGVMLLTLLSPSTSPAPSLSRGQRHRACHPARIILNDRVVTTKRFVFFLNLKQDYIPCGSCKKPCGSILALTLKIKCFTKEIV